MNKYNENQFILQLCKINTYDREKMISLINDGLDYPYILGHLLYNRVGGAAYTVLKESNLLFNMNREFRNTLKMVYDCNCIRQDSSKKVLSLLCRMFDNIGVPYALLKGSFLVDIYSKGIRTSNDVDILVNQNNISAITEMLRNNGFKQGNIRSGKFLEATRLEILSSRLNRGETVPFIKEVDLPQMEFCEIDINYSFDYKARQETNIVEEFLNNTQPSINTEYGSMNTLKISYFLIQLCLHLYKEATVLNWVKMGRDISLYKYMDIYVFIYKFFDENFSDEFISIVKKYNLERECYYTLYYTKLLFDISNEYLNNILKCICPTNLEYLKHIFDPETKKMYEFKDSYMDWAFSNNKLEKLYEINYG